MVIQETAKQNPLGSSKGGAGCPTELDDSFRVKSSIIRNKLSLCVGILKGSAQGQLD